MAQQLAILTDENIAQAVSQQLAARGVTVERLINVLPEGTLDPDVLEFAHANGYALLTHDEAITEHTAARHASGKEHAGVLIAPRRFQGPQGIGVIVNYLLELHDFIQAGAASVADDVYNQVNYVE